MKFTLFLRIYRPLNTRIQFLSILARILVLGFHDADLVSKLGRSTGQSPVGIGKGAISELECQF